MHRIATQPCACHSMPASIPRIQGCIFARKGRDLGTLFQENAACLRQNCNNATLASWDDIDSALTSVSAQICRIHRRIGKDKGWLVEALLRPAVKEVWERARSTIPSILHKSRLSSLKDDHPHLVFLQLDKNTGKTVCVCRHLYYRTMIDAFGDQTQFELVEECNNKRTARDKCMQLLQTSAEEHGLSKLWEGGKGKGPPHAFQLPKNKIQEESACEWKHRIVFSYYAHPLKKFSRKMGRCLTQLLREASHTLQSLDMDRIIDVKQWAASVSAHASQCANRKRPATYSLWELDIRDFFPSMSCPDTLQAVRTVHDLLVDVRGKRTDATGGIWGCS